MAVAAVVATEWRCRGLTWLLFIITFTAITVCYLLMGQQMVLTEMQPFASYIQEAEVDNNPTTKLSRPTTTTNSPVTTTTDPAVLNDHGYLVDTPGCRIPAMHPYDPSILKYLTKPKNVDCSQRPEKKDKNGITLPSVPFIKIESNSTTLWISGADRDNPALKCCYRPFWRSTNYTDPGNIDNKEILSKKCIPFIREVSISSYPFVRVECLTKNNTKLELQDVVGFFPDIPVVEQRIVNQILESTPSRPPMSVLLIGIDAVSRLNLLRYMPKTVHILNEIGTINMLGYNKVADNTFPNLVPILSGLFEEELTKTCWPKSNSYFDDCPWIWNNFSTQGYRTLFAEDAVWMGIFNYVKMGFLRPPTDYYLRPLVNHAEDELGTNKLMNAALCVGRKWTLQFFMDLVHKFAYTMGDRSYFGLFWGVSLTHDMLEMAQPADKVVADLLKKMFMDDLFKNTMLIMLSDHGMRWGSIRQTYQGRLEERLPFLYFRAPKWFHKEYPLAMANLRRNSKRLTTPFDLHATLEDLLNPEGNLNAAALSYRSLQLNRQSEENVLPRGISLFMPMPMSRTCSQAGIKPHWCTCQDSRLVNTTDETVTEAVTYLIQNLNNKLKSYKQCAILTLNLIHEARILLPTETVQEEAQRTIVDYQLLVETTPGGAMFEATVRHRLDAIDTHTHDQQNSKLLLSKFELVGSVSRINAYGHQSHCVLDFHMKLYCYCQ